LKKTLPHPLLGTLSAETFMRRYWQKKPLLIRQAVAGIQPMLSRQQLFALAESQDVESRLVVNDTLTGQWRLKSGPMRRRSLPSLKQSHWTLLVQGVDLHDDKVAQLRDQFRFIPDARLDDVMISYATDQGGVGPHFDSYDVFLLQVHGQRRWRISQQKDLSLRDDVPLKILRKFKAEETWVLNPGDMLYLPPQCAHDGVALGDCMTYSIGFKAQTPQALAQQLLPRFADMDVVKESARYRDQIHAATDQPARIPEHLQAFAHHALESALRQKHASEKVLGEWLSEPKAQVWFDTQDPKDLQKGVVLDRKTKMLYDQRYVYINGESWRCEGADARTLRSLADQRVLNHQQIQKSSETLLAVLEDWGQSGWLHPQGEQTDLKS
jgi:50S ribosomal protein L16 3-hydroxylase